MRSSPSASPKRLARAIRARREDLGLTQEGAAERCGVSARFLRRLEAGNAGVSFEVVERIVAGLDWTWALLGQQMAPAGAQQRRQVRDGAPQAVHDLLETAWRNGGGRDKAALAQVLKRFSVGPQPAHGRDSDD
jgi:transcriptional regulator with XRE-family HTH domain